MRPSKNAAALGLRGLLGKQFMNADTTMREAANLITFGGADFLERDLMASTNRDRSSTFRDKLDAAAREQEARRQYDRENRRGAVGAGQALGLILAARGGRNAWSNYVRGMSTSGKGNVGEIYSALKTIAGGDIPINFQFPLPLASGRSTKVDHRTMFGKGSVEAKYCSGRHEPLRGMQKEAQEQYGRKYRHDKWGPGDDKRMGSAAGFGFGVGELTVRDGRGN